VTGNGAARQPYLVCGHPQQALPLFIRRGREGVEATGELRRFEPAGKEVYFRRGQAEGGTAIEGEFGGAGSVDDGGGGAEPRNQRGQPVEAGGIEQQLPLARNNPDGLGKLKAGLQARPSDFPIVVNEVGAALNILDQAGGRRDGGGVGVGQQAGVKPALRIIPGGFDEGFDVREIAPSDAVGIGRAVKADIAIGGEPWIAFLQQVVSQGGNSGGGQRCGEIELIRTARE